MDQKRVLGIVFFTVFLDLLGFGIIIPIQPFFAEKLGASPTVVTWLGACFSLMQFLFAPFWGRLSDRIGRRPVMLVSTMITVVGYTAFGFAGTLGMLFAARMLAGFGSANIGTAMAIITDTTDATSRAKGMGLVGAAFGLGFIIGPALGGAVAHLGMSAPAFVAAGLCLINFNFAYFMLPETLTKKNEAKSLLPDFKQTGKRMKEVLAHQNLFRLLIVYFLFATGFSLMEQVIGLFVDSVWVKGESAVKAAQMTAVILLIVGIVSTIVQGALIGRLAKKFGEKHLYIFGHFIIATSFLLTPVVGNSGSYPLMLLVCGLTAFGAGIANPSLNSLLSKTAADTSRGGTMGLGQSISALGRVAGPGIAGWLFEINRGLPYTAGAALIYLCAGLGYTIKSSAKTGE